MQKAPIPEFEDERLSALKNLKLLDTDPEERFDSITKKVTQVFSVPISTVTLIDKNREWYKSVQGLDTKEGPRETSFCGHALTHEIVFVVEDTLKDPRFADNPMVIGGPKIRFYVGKALYDHKSKLPVGVLCMKDYKPRKFSLNDMSKFLEIAEEAEREINKNAS